MKTLSSSYTWRLAAAVLIAACNRAQPMPLTPFDPSAPTPTVAIVSTPVSIPELEQALGECSSPCWAGIEIGEMSAEAAQQFLVERYGEANVLNQTFLARSFLQWIAAPKDISQTGNVNTRANVVNHVAVQFDPGAVTVERLLGAIGEPAFVNVTASMEPPSDCFKTTLIYPEFGITAYVLPTRQSNGIFEEQVVTSLDFADLAENSEFWKWTDTTTLDWNGYQDYCEAQRQWLTAPPPPPQATPAVSRTPARTSTPPPSP